VGFETYHASVNTIQFLEYPCEGVTLLVTSCLSSIMMLTTPIAPYNDDVINRVFKLMVETL